MAPRTNKRGSEIEVRRELRLLEALEGDHHLTQRNLSTTLGVALGLTNLYLKRLVRKGYIKCVNVRSNRVRYLITPKGLAQKARLTYEFMEYSLRSYRKTREHLHAVLGAGIRDGCRHVVIYGTGEPAELAYLSLKEFGLEPIAIFDGEAHGEFLGMAVRPLQEHASLSYDLMIVATLDRSGTLQAQLVEAGVPENKLCALRPLVNGPKGERTGARRRESGKGSTMSPLLSSLVDIAREAGEQILGCYGEPIVVERKTDQSPLTRADRVSHDTIMAALRQKWPDVPVVSEEGDEPSAAGSEREFLVDPLDGTKEFIRRSGDFTVNLALVEQGHAVAGVVHVPVRGVTYAAERAKGAWKLNGAGKPSRLATSPSNGTLRVVASRDHAGPQVDRLLGSFPDAECLSIGSSLKFCLVAEGRADVYLRDVPTMEWDTAAAQIIVEEAGGVVTDLSSNERLGYGKPERRNGAILTVASRELSDKIRAILS